jgi:hypothetical protein
MEPEEKIQGKGQQCDSCHAGIGEGFIQRKLNRVGNSELKICDWCVETLKRLGYLQITELIRLLPDGRVVSRHGSSPPDETTPIGRPPIPGRPRGEKRK